MDATGTTRGRGTDERARGASAEALARLRLAELEAVIECIPDGVYVGDASGVRYGNRTALEQLGYDSVEELNRHVATLMEEVCARRLDGSVLAVEDNVFVRALGGESASMDVVIRHRREGDDRVLRSSAAPIRQGGRIIGAVAVNVDVTAERRAAEEVRTARALVSLEREVLAMVVQGAPAEAVVAALASGLERLASPGLLASVLLLEDGRLRHGAAPSLPPAWSALIDGTPIGPSVGSCGTAAFRRERVVVADVATDPLWADFRDSALAHGLRACWSEPICDSRGEVMGTVALYYREPRSPTEADLAVIEGTSRVARIALERYRDDRARDQAAREREAMLAELRATLHHNEVLNAILGHDLRNPLAAVLSGAEVALRRDGAADRATLEVVVASAKRMARMIDQLLDLSRIRSGGVVPIVRAPVDLDAVVRAVRAELELVFPDRRFEVATTGDLRGAWDGDRLSQIAANLLGNAAQHGDEGGAVTLRLDGGAADQVVLEVHNDGAIADDVQPWLFDPFRRGSAGGARADGLGLGLYITREIARAHGGDVTVRSSATDGTTFRVTLPRHQRPPSPRCHEPKCTS